MLTLFIIGLLASGFHCSVAQILRPRSQQDQLDTLEELVRALGNGLDQLSDKVDKLLDDKMGPGAQKNPTWLPLSFVEARRQYGEKENTFSLEFKSAVPTGDVELEWKLQPSGEEKVLTLQKVDKNEPSDDPAFVASVQTSVKVDKRGELTLSIKLKGFEVLFLFDNSDVTAKQSRSQRDIPFNNFAVDVPEKIPYQKGEQIVLPVTAKNAGDDKYKLNVNVALTYINPSKYITEHKCLVNDWSDIVCEADLKKKYFSSMDLELLVKTGIVNPTGYSKVQSTYEDPVALVRGIKLTRILNIVPADQAKAYPDGYFDVMAQDAECSVRDKKCSVRCVIYGNMDRGDPKGAVVGFAKVKDDGKLDVISNQITYLDEQPGQKIAVVTMRPPRPEEEISKEEYVCTVKPDKGKKVEGNGKIVYTFKTQVDRQKSFFEMNAKVVKIRCLATGNKNLEAAATLRIKPPEKEDYVSVNYVDHEVMNVGKHEQASVFTFKHSFGNINSDHVKATCYARDQDQNPDEFDFFELTKVEYLEAEVTA